MLIRICLMIKLTCLFSHSFHEKIPRDNFVMSATVITLCRALSFSKTVSSRKVDEKNSG